ncbi:MAG: cytochrome c [Flavobacteriaceae bacterium]
MTLAVTGPASAAEDPIAARQAVMKSNGAAVGALAKMVKGETEYNALAAEMAMRTISSGLVAFPSLFPAGSETGGDTKASPKIWEDMAGFQQAAAKATADAAAAIGPAGQGLDALKGVFGTVARNCAGCHETYQLSSK